VKVICPTAQAKYFCAADWTTQITLNRLTKIQFTRIRFREAKGPDNRDDSRKIQLICSVGQNLEQRLQKPAILSRAGAVGFRSMLRAAHRDTFGA
jgi:hypothetical protein